MCFSDVDHEKSHAVPILIVKLVEGGNLPPERRSGVAAENQDDGLLFVQGRKLHTLGLVQLQQ